MYYIEADDLLLTIDLVLIKDNQSYVTYYFDSFLEYQYGICRLVSLL